MRLVLKEEPREWRNFAWAGCGAAVLLAGVLVWRKVLPQAGFVLVCSVAGLIAVLAGFAPRLFRPAYRAGMKISFRMGLVMQTILLTLIYIFVLAPLALLLRVLRKDPLGVRRSDANSFWKEARKPGTLDQQF
jgi:hypothetical protein